jgi:hypothetical protein
MTNKEEIMSEVVKPTGFKDLDAAELYRSAIEDFAIPVEESDKKSKKVLLAAIAEGGVSWADYVKQHPDVAPDPVEEPVAVVPPRAQEKARVGGVVTSEDVTGVDVAPSLTVEPEIVVAQPIAQKPDQKWLIKMVRDNAIFEVKGYRFTQEHPYALVSAGMADFLLTQEDGFRQATPSELREFYG